MLVTGDCGDELINNIPLQLSVLVVALDQVHVTNDVVDLLSLALDMLELKEQKLVQQIAGRCKVR